VAYFKTLTRHSLGGDETLSNPRAQGLACITNKAAVDIMPQNFIREVPHLKLGRVTDHPI